MEHRLIRQHIAEFLQRSGDQIFDVDGEGDHGNKGV
jgi:hypothetical protein